MHTRCLLSLLVVVSVAIKSLLVIKHSGTASSFLEAAHSLSRGMLFFRNGQSFLTVLDSHCLKFLHNFLFEFGVVNK